ncbi:MAG: hypothetical protein J6R41_01295, partial [Paludibacteraceae bacterium]|nr:hypothetical protein [Paludibacteraceae bacterium]
LGHGVYKLQHTFAYKQLAETKGKTDNLMDYNGGSFLAHYQWRVMQDSVMFVWKVLQDDEDGLLFEEEIEKLKKATKEIKEIIEKIVEILPFSYDVIKELRDENKQLFSRLENLIVKFGKEELLKCLSGELDCIKKMSECEEEDIIERVKCIIEKMKELSECSSGVLECKRLSDAVKKMSECEGDIIKRAECINEGMKKVYPNFMGELWLKMDTIMIKGLEKVALKFCSEVKDCTEEKKKVFFKSNYKCSVATLLYEFGTGTGENVRLFEELEEENDESFRKCFWKGQSETIVKKILEEKVYPKYTYKEFCNTQTYEDYKASGYASIEEGYGLAFSPDQTEGISESIKRHLDANLAQFFIGGCIVYFFPAKSENEVTHADVVIYNKTSRKSLLCHLETNYERQQNPPYPALSTIIQIIHYKIKINKNEFKKD